MENRLLFINKRPEVIQDFLARMQGREFEIDIADSGILGAQMLREKEYKVVITGMVMAEYDGEKIISYLNEHHPNTRCIVFTTRINPGQILYLTNVLKVFRIFLRSEDYKGEMLRAIEEGFLQYDLLCQEAEQLRMNERQNDQRPQDFLQEEEGYVKAKDAEVFGRISLALLETTSGSGTPKEDDEENKKTEETKSLLKMLVSNASK